MAESTIGIRLDSKLRARLETLGKQRDRSPHYLMKKAVERFIESEEAIEAEKQLMIDRWQTFALTGETLSNQNVEEWLTSLDTKAE